MKTEIISIGTEITSGQNLDTNSQWLSQRLAEIGIPVAFHTTVGDDVADNLDVFRAALARTELIISTGGLGPTLDDLTREVVAQVVGVELVFHEPSWRHIQELFAKRLRHLPERNRVQAMIPLGAESLFNPVGTAPGIWMNIGAKIIAAMPGVPSEMYRMFQDQVRPRLQALGMGGGVIVQRKINVFGAGESAVEEKLKDITRRGAVPEVGITASDAVISLRILARANTSEEALAMCAPVERIIRERLGNLVYGVENEELQDVVMRLLAEKQLSVATAESMTAGLVAHKLAQVPGASKHLRGGIVCYDNRVKIELVGANAELVEAANGVSGGVAGLLAEGARTKLHADLGLSVVGYAGPEAGGPSNPVGMTFVGLAWSGGVKIHSFIWPGNRVEIQGRAARMALNSLRLHLLGE